MTIRISRACPNEFTEGLNLDIRLLVSINAAAIVLAIVVVAFAWFYIREQFMWAIIVTLFFLVPIVSLNVLLLSYDFFSIRESRKRQPDG